MIGVDNGAMIMAPITVAVDHPMTPQDYVKSIHVVADDNPTPEVMSVHFTPASGKAEMSTRMRLAKTGTLIEQAIGQNADLLDVVSPEARTRSRVNSSNVRRCDAGRTRARSCLIMTPNNHDRPGSHG